MRSAWGFLLVAACTGAGPGTGDPVETIVALQGDPVNGEAVYNSTCAVCHAEDGSGDSGPDIRAEEERATLASVIWYGTGSMAGYEGILTEQESADIIAYMEASIMGATTGTDDTGPTM